MSSSRLNWCVGSGAKLLYGLGLDRRVEITNNFCLVVSDNKASIWCEMYQELMGNLGGWRQSRDFLLCNNLFLLKGETRLCKHSQERLKRERSAYLLGECEVKIVSMNPTEPTSWLKPHKFEMFSSPIISNCGNVAAIVAEGHGAHPSIIGTPCKYRRGGREQVPAWEDKGGQRWAQWRMMANVCHQPFPEFCFWNYGESKNKPHIKYHQNTLVGLVLPL